MLFGADGQREGACTGWNLGSHILRVPVRFSGVRTAAAARAVQEAGAYRLGADCSRQPGLHGLILGVSLLRCQGHHRHRQRLRRGTALEPTPPLKPVGVAKP